jgi:hypothetical protein
VNSGWRFPYMAAANQCSRFSTGCRDVRLRSVDAGRMCLYIQNGNTYLLPPTRHNKCNTGTTPPHPCLKFSDLPISRPDHEISSTELVPRLLVSYFILKCTQGHSFVTRQSKLRILLLYPGRLYSFGDSTMYALYCNCCLVSARSLREG